MSAMVLQQVPVAACHSAAAPPARGVVQAHAAAQPLVPSAGPAWRLYVPGLHQGVQGAQLAAAAEHAAKALQGGLPLESARRSFPLAAWSPVPAPLPQQPPPRRTPAPAGQAQHAQMPPARPVVQIPRAQAPAPGSDGLAVPGTLQPAQLQHQQEAPRLTLQQRPKGISSASACCPPGSTADGRAEAAALFRSTEAALQSLMPDHQHLVLGEARYTSPTRCASPRPPTLEAAASVPAPLVQASGVVAGRPPTVPSGSSVAAPAAQARCRSAAPQRPGAREGGGLSAPSPRGQSPGPFRRGAAALSSAAASSPALATAVTMQQGAVGSVGSAGRPPVRPGASASAPPPRPGGCSAAAPAGCGAARAASPSLPRQHSHMGLSSLVAAPVPSAGPSQPPPAHAHGPPPQPAPQKPRSESMPCILQEEVGEPRAAPAAGARPPAAAAEERPAAAPAASKAGLQLDPVEQIRYGELQFHSHLGSGEFGQVCRGYWKGKEVAIKELFWDDLGKPEAILKDLLKEIESFRHLRHKRLVSFLGACLEPPHLCLVTEYMPGGSLHHLLHVRKQRLPPLHAVNMCLQLADGVTYLHGLHPCVVHRDLKSQNVVLDMQLNLKLCDFGLTESMERTHITKRNNGGSPRYMAPELFDQKTKITEKVDIWAMGCIFIEIFGGKLPYEGINTLGDLTREMLVNKRTPELPRDGPDNIKRVIVACHNFDHRHRPSSRAVFEQLRDCKKQLRDAGALGQL